MSLDDHIGIATAALKRGFIDSKKFVSVMNRLENGGETAPAVEEFWLESGCLTPEQLDLVRLDAGQSTREKLPAPAGIVKGKGETLPFASFAQGTSPAPHRRGDTRTFGTEPTMRHPNDPIEQFVVAASSPGLRTVKPASTDTRLDEREPTLISSAGDDSSAATRLLQGKASMPAVGIAPGSDDAHASPHAKIRYAHIEVLGTGGLGEVSACYDALLGRSVAVKAARADIEPGAREILEREARIVAGLEHPNIIPVYDAGVLADAGPYYVMRVVSQATLEEVIASKSRGDEEAVAEYGIKRLLRYFIQICQAIDYANNRGVVHCDLKPANILLGDYGDVLVVDWGLAYSANFPGGPRGGTPGYMAPEQLDREYREFDARTDVFALGAILYQLLCLRPAFPHVGTDSETTAGQEPIRRYKEPKRPSSFPDVEGLSTDLEELCLKALSLEAADRYATAGELAAEVEAYLEGTKEAERRKAEAARFAEAGDELAERYHEFVESRPEELADLEEYRVSTPPWAPVEEKVDLWDAEDMLAVTDALRVRTLQAAVSSYEQALEAVPSHKGARRDMARLYWQELLKARRERNQLNQIHFEQLVLQYDDGHFRKSLESPGTLLVSGATPEVTLTLRTLREDQRRLVAAETRDLDERRLVVVAVQLQPGRYVLEASRDGGRSIRYPVRIDPGSEVTIHLNLAGADSLADDEVMVPGGPALLGDAETLMSSGDPRMVTVDTFVIEKWPVTFAQYLEFLESLRRASNTTLRSHVPQTPMGSPFWSHHLGGWMPTSAIGTDDREAALLLPVYGVSASNAQAYALWRSERDGVSYRLPRDSEWEKAARGTDGRVFPWGDHFDATFCKMRQSRPGLSQPERSGVFTADESPYGVRDLAGGIADWVLPDAEVAADTPAGERLVHSRGGAWCDWPIDCRVSARRDYLASEHSTRVGFRLVRDL